MPKLTYKKHKARWKDCSRCELACTRKRVVFARGKVPSDVVFLGEAPWNAEEVLGRTFAGPAGLLLDDMIEKAIYVSRWRISFVNLVGCKVMPPTEKQIVACAPRLDEYLRLLAKPRLIITVGELATTYAPKLLNYEPKYWSKIVHPARILRSRINQGLLIQRTVEAIRDSFTLLEEE